MDSNVEFIKVMISRESYEIKMEQLVRSLLEIDEIMFQEQNEKTEEAMREAA